MRRFLLASILSACGVAGLAGCAHTPDGRLQYQEIASASEGRNLRFGIYEPPAWDHRTPLPLVVLLHGAGDDETAADRKVVTDRLDRAITEGRLPPFLMVTPDGERGLWMDWYDGSHHYKSWVLDDLIPAVRKSRPVVDGPGGLHILGVSMGGGGALQMWLADPARFASATIISAPIFNESDIRAFLRKYMPPDVMERAFGPSGSGHGFDPYALHSRADLNDSRLVFGAAERDLDAVVKSNSAFDAHLTQAGVPHRYVQFRGHHLWTAWAPMIEYSLCHQLQPACSMPDPSDWIVRAVD